MRHRAPRHLPALLRLHRVRPRRRLARLATRWHASSWLPSRPSTRLASALAATLLLLTGGALAVGALDDDTVPAVDDASPDRSFVRSTSRSIDRQTLSSTPHDKGTPEPVTTTPEERTTPHAQAPAPSTPTSYPSPSPRESSLPVRAPVAPLTDGTPSLPTPGPSDTPDLPTQAGTHAAGHGSGTPTVTVDRTSPSTVLASTPGRRDDSATADFSFHADEDASFTCSLDGGAFRPCGSGAGYTVQPGWHDFAVRATDRAGNVDTSPAQWHWHTSARD
jgi:hypothetical protein